MVNVSIVGTHCQCQAIISDLNQTSPHQHLTRDKHNAYFAAMFAAAASKY